MLHGSITSRLTMSTFETCYNYCFIDLPINITTPVIKRADNAAKAVLDNVKELGSGRYPSLLSWRCCALKMLSFNKNKAGVVFLDYSFIKTKIDSVKPNDWNCRLELDTRWKREKSVEWKVVCFAKDDGVVGDCFVRRNPNTRACRLNIRR